MALRIEVVEYVVVLGLFILTVIIPLPVWVFPTVTIAIMEHTPLVGYAETSTPPMMRWTGPDQPASVSGERLQADGAATSIGVTAGFGSPSAAPQHNSTLAGHDGPSRPGALSEPSPRAP